MSTLAKLRVAAMICGLFLVWPAVHRVVVATCDTNAWQLGGFAMYATPPARTRVQIFENRGGQKTLFGFESDPPALALQRRLYTMERAILGALLPPDALAEAFFRERKAVDHIEVVITREMLSASTARIERRKTVYEYARSR